VKRPLTVRARIAIGTFCLLACVLGVAAAAIEAELREETLRSLDARLRGEAEALAALTRFDGKRLQLASDDDALAAFVSTRSTAYIEVFADGRPVERSRSLTEKDLPLIDVEHTRERARRRTIDGPFGEPLRITWAHVTRAAPDSGATVSVVVAVARRIAEVERSRHEVEEAMAWALPLALVVGTLGAFVLARRATAPIERLASEAREVGVSSLAKRLDVGLAAGDLQDLAATLNEAFERLAAGLAREKRFSADVAHELRTPLATARATLELALSRERAAEEYRASIDATLAAVVRLDGIVDALLVLGRAESGSLARSPTDVRAAVVAAADAVKPVADRASVPVRIEVPEEALEVRGHAPLLERLVFNLLENGIRHGASRDGVVVATRGSGRNVEIVVSDRGPGVPDEFMDRVFERFARAEGSRTRATGGAGLGLAIVQAIARGHGGVAVARRREGGGTEVVVTLPRD
jgi:signal transduction histidine kinase